MSDEQPESTGWSDLAAAWQKETAGAERVANIDVGKLRRKARRFAWIIRLRNLREVAACAAMTWLGIGVLSEEGPAVFHLMGASFIGCSAWIAWMVLWRARNAQPPPPTASGAEVLQALRAELLRQAQLLHDVWRWYLLPCLVPMVMMMASTVVGFAQDAPLTGKRLRALFLILAIMAAVTVVSFAFVHWLNRRAARQLREEAARLLDAPAAAPGNGEDGRGAGA
jgi:hypothetical protein